MGVEPRAVGDKYVILLGLGSNLPFLGRAPAEIVERALAALARLGAVERRSRLYHSPAWPRETDPPFVNAAAAIRTDLGPQTLLEALQGIEAGFGRRPAPRNAPRTLDVDLLDYDGRIWLATPQCRLELPHPRLADRDFVLAPLAEAAPEWRHPARGERALELLALLPRRSARPL